MKYGRWYNGTVNVTKSGHQCQAWDQNFPQVHDRSPSVFPELVGAENFCRNPGAEEDRPWCYTVDKLVRWDECNIQPCGKEASLDVGICISVFVGICVCKGIIYICVQMGGIRILKVCFELSICFVILASKEKLNRNRDE